MMVKNYISDNILTCISVELTFNYSLCETGSGKD